MPRAPARRRTPPKKSAAESAASRRTRREPRRPPSSYSPGRYAVVISWSDEDRCFVAYVPDLEPCSAFGDTAEEALKEIQVAAGLWLEVARDHRMEIPPVSFGEDDWLTPGRT